MLRMEENGLGWTHLEKIRRFVEVSGYLHDSRGNYLLIKM